MTLSLCHGLRNAVDLHGEQHGDARAVQFPGKHHHGGRSPTVAEEDDVRLRFFLVAQHAVMIGVEQAQDGFVGCLPVAVLENLDRGALRQFLLKFVRQPHGPVVQDRRGARIRRQSR